MARLSVMPVADEFWKRIEEISRSDRSGANRKPTAKANPDRR
jgi:hypothetical protein